MQREDANAHRSKVIKCSSSIRLTGHITVLVFFRIWFPTRLFEGNDEVLANDDVTNLSWHLLSEERSLDYLGPVMAKRIRQASKKFSQILMIHLNIYMFNYTRLILVCGILLTSMLSNNIVVLDGSVYSSQCDFESEWAKTMPTQIYSCQ